MEDPVGQVLEDIVNKTLSGPGFIIHSHQQRGELKKKLEDYFLELIFDILMQHLTDQQIAELEATPDLESQETQMKVAEMAKAVPGFDVILKAQLNREASEIGNSGKIPETTN